MRQVCASGSPRGGFYARIYYYCTLHARQVLYVILIITIIIVIIMRWRRDDETLTPAQFHEGYCDKSQCRVPIHILLPLGRRRHAKITNCQM